MILIKDGRVIDPKSGMDEPWILLSVTGSLRAWENSRRVMIMTL